MGFSGSGSSSFSGGGATIVNQSVSPTTTTVTSTTTQTANGGFSNTTTYYNGAPNGTCICGTGGTSGGATTTVAAPGVVNGSSTSFFGNFYGELAHPRPLGGAGLGIRGLLRSWHPALIFAMPLEAGRGPDSFTFYHGTDSTSTQRSFWCAIGRIVSQIKHA